MSSETFAKLGYWRIGGPMERFVRPDTVDELRAALIDARERGRGFFVLGRGSNLLVPDEGLPGTTVQLAGDLAAIHEVDPGGSPQGVVELRVGAGVANAVLLHRHLGVLRGLGPLAGVPGTMGGAIAMNAGTSLGEIGAVVARVEGLDADGVLRTIERRDLPMAYRQGGLPPGFVVTAAVLRLTRTGAADEKEAVAIHLARRAATQPLDLPSCGSVFRNPSGDSAGRLIEAAGLKGWRCGDAQISPKHANFIVNLGNAKATDVIACIRTAMNEVHSRFHVLLSTEVQIVGRLAEIQWQAPPDLG